MMRGAAAVATSFLLLVTVGGFGAPPAGAADTFTVSGEVSGLYPGIDTTLPARVHNPLDVTLRIVSLGAVTTADDPACPEDYLVVADATPDVVVAPGASATVPLGVHLDRVAPDACQGASFSLTFRGVAVDAAGEPAGATAAAPTGSLPFTGTAPLAIAAVGLGMVAIGVAATRRARSVVR